jgi:hypothetical protein
VRNTNVLAASLVSKALIVWEVPPGVAFSAVILAPRKESSWFVVLVAARAMRMISARSVFALEWNRYARLVVVPEAVAVETTPFVDAA